MHVSFSHKVVASKIVCEKVRIVAHLAVQNLDLCEILRLRCTKINYTKLNTRDTGNIRNTFFRHKL